MPGLIADCFDAVGEELTDWLDLLPVEPAYRAHFADGSQLDVHTDAEAMAEEIGRGLRSARAPPGFRRYVEFVTRLYRWEMRSFIDRNIDSPLDLVRPDLAAAAARSAASGGSRPCSRRTCRTSGCSGCSASRRCTPGSRRTKRWRSTP